MKRVIPLLISMLLIVLMAAAFSFPASAAGEVIYVKDGGTGDGSSAANALMPTTGNYDPSATNPARQEDTALYQAIKKLMESGGGTIVICGPVVLNAETGQGTSATTRDFMVYNLSEYKPDVTITYTSVYDGVDYRETEGARLVLDATSHFISPTASVWENITIATFDGTRTLNAGSNKMTLGQGFTSVPMDESRVDDPTAYLTVCGGERYKKNTNNTDITIDIGDGVIGAVYGAQNGAGQNYQLIGDTNVTINSGTILGSVGGTSRTASTPVEGNANVTINGGVFKGSIDACGNSGFLNTDAIVKLIITGGDFTDCFGINDYGVGMSNNTPSYSLLDYSQCDETAAAQIYNLIIGFDEVVAPEGMTAPTTTEPVTPDTSEPTVDSTNPVDSTDPVDSTTPGTTPPVDSTTPSTTPTTPAPSDNDDGMSTTTIIIIIVCAVVVVAVIVVIVVMSKKKGKKD